MEESSAMYQGYLLQASHFIIQKPCEGNIFEATLLFFHETPKSTLLLTPKTVTGHDVGGSKYL
jgi:hypothetical protein